MRTRILLLAFLGLSTSAFAQFTTGNLAIVRVGDGTTTLGSASAQTVVLDHSKTGATSTIGAALNGAAGARLSNSGSASSEGALQLSGNGQYLTLAGYDAAAGVASITGTASLTTNRMIGRIDLSGAVSYTASSTIDDKNNIRGAWTNTGTDFYSSGAGAVGGINYVNGATATNVSGSLLNTRVVAGFGGDLYFTSASGAFLGLNKVSGLPTGASTVTNMINAGTGSSSYGFFFANANTVYIADDRATTAGGIQKWTFSAGSWSLAYTLGTGVANVGARGLTGDVDSSGNVTLYATTAEATNNRLISIADTGSSSAATTLDNAGANFVFRGVASTPVPEPASMVALGLGLAGIVARKRRK